MLRHFCEWVGSVPAQALALGVYLGQSTPPWGQLCELRLQWDHARSQMPCSWGDAVVLAV